MKTILLILGSQTDKRAGGKYKKSLFLVAQEQLEKKFDVIITIVEDGYDIPEEITKWKKAGYNIYQYPIFWFMMPQLLKKYIDGVYEYG